MPLRLWVDKAGKFVVSARDLGRKVGDPLGLADAFWAQAETVEGRRRLVRWAVAAAVADGGAQALAFAAQLKRRERGAGLGYPRRGRGSGIRARRKKGSRK